MKKKIFLVVSLVTITASLLIFASGIFAISISAKNAVLERLEAETRLMSALISSEEDFKKLDIYKSDNDMRVTIIDQSGGVLYETDTSQPLENHADREEFIAAIEGSPKVVERYSETFGCNMNYYAVKKQLGDGTTVVLRLAVRDTLINSYVTLSMPVFILLLLIVLGLSFEAGNRIAGKVAGRISEINASVQSVAEGNYTPVKADSRDAELYALIGSINDVNARISDYIASEKTQRTKLAAVLSSISQGIVAVNRDKEIIFINKSALDLFGIQLKNPEREKRDLLYVIDNLDLYGKISSRIGETSSFDFRLGEKELHISLKNVDDPDLREEISSIIVISDITAEKAVARQKSDFFQNASHELKTPVTVIRGLTEIMLQKHPEDDFIRQKLITVHNESVRLASIIADMLKLSGLETADESGEDDEPPLTELADVARELADELSERIEEKHLSVTISGGGSVYIHKKDAFELIENLLSNALNYNKEGGKVDICVKRDGGKVILSVSDTGIGIEQQHIPRLCERFYRVDKSRSKKTGGTGLGLAIVKHICIRYNASLDIESVFGEGTCVTVGFPAPDGV